MPQSVTPNIEQFYEDEEILAIIAESPSLTAQFNGQDILNSQVCVVLPQVRHYPGYGRNQFDVDVFVKQGYRTGSVGNVPGVRFYSAAGGPASGTAYRPSGNWRGNSHRHGKHPSWTRQDPNQVSAKGREPGLTDDSCRVATTQIINSL